MRLELRDNQVLAETFLSKVVRRDDLIAFGYFNSIPRCNSRLLALKQEGLLKSRSELGGMELYSYLYHCTAKGVRIAANALNISPDEAIEIHRNGIRELAIKHALRCSDLRTKFLRELTESDEVALASWSQELLCHHEFQFGGSATVIKPDALAVVKAEGISHHLFIEVDLGNAALSKVLQKLCRYRTYSESGAFHEAYESDRFAVLFVTTDDRRLAHLQKLTTSVHVLFTTWKRLSLLRSTGAIYATTRDDHRRLGEALR